VLTLVCAGPLLWCGGPPVGAPSLGRVRMPTRRGSLTICVLLESIVQCRVCAWMEMLLDGDIDDGARRRPGVTTAAP